MSPVFTVCLLDHSHLDQSVKLHQKVIDSLPADQKHFLLPKSEDYFSSHITHGTANAIIGIFDGEQLVAQALVHNPTTQNPQTGMVDMKPVAAPEQVSVLQSVVVDPDYRGCGLMHTLVQGWINLAQAQGRAHLLSEIALSNAASWRTFLSAGLSIVGIGKDPSDGTLVYNAHGKTGSLTAKFNKAALSCPVTDIVAQIAYLDSGYAITGFDKTTQKMLLSGPQ